MQETHSMKAQTKIILSLSIAMTLIFAGLLMVQVRYLNDSLKLRNQQFSKSVRGIFSDILNGLESSEAERYLCSFLLEEYKCNVRKSGIKKDVPAVNHTCGDKPITTNIQNHKIHTSGISDHSVALVIPESVSDTLRLHLHNKYYHQKRQVENAVIKWMAETSKLPIQERVDFNELDILISNALENHGINIPYHFSVVVLNEDGQWTEVYKCPEFEETEEQTVFEQKLFPNEHSPNSSYLKLFFPTKRDYILSSMTLIMPSIILTSLLLIIFTVTLLIIFRQKKLDDIKKDFVNNMTHEIKTPISTISLASQMLQEPEMTKTPESIKSIAKVIKSETGRLSFLAEKILLMSIEHGNSTLKMKEANMNEMITHCIATFSLKVENTGGRIISDLNAANPYVVVDETHFTNVIFNIMDNAVKYSKEDEPLLLSVKTWNDNKGFLFISIKDNGIGIKKESQNRIFERFYRVSTGNVHNVKGFGLGLAYVKQIIDVHKASITAESELNIGTKFIIKIPTLKEDGRQGKNFTV